MTPAPTPTAPQTPEKARPVVTIAIPTYNRSHFVVRAIQSVLSQAYHDLQLVVSDNASDDDTVARIAQIQDHRLLLIRQPQNFGYLRNLNTCLENAKGELFVMLSDDDVLEPTFVERLSQPFIEGFDGQSAGSIGMSWCPCLITNENGQPLWTTEAGPRLESSASMIAALFSGKRGPRFCSVMIRTPDAIAVGGYDARHGPLCDTGNWARVALHYQYAACIREPLARYAVHSGSHTSNSTCQEWQELGRVLGNDLLRIVQSRNDSAAEELLIKANRNNISNLTLTVLMQVIGTRRGLIYLFRELIRAPRYLLNAFVARRILQDGWKIVRLRP
ncbi:MAG: glycosyltransferase family 2 protein, partial [Acidobacteriaceae bacterium]|nr:glycosyltransferase family 2 protein [Acidobacteriaceae bacterium]